jgi:hypothetical protein
MAVVEAGQGGTLGSCGEDKRARLERKVAPCAELVSTVGSIQWAEQVWERKLPCDNERSVVQKMAEGPVDGLGRNRWPQSRSRYRGSLAATLAKVPPVVVAQLFCGATSHRESISDTFTLSSILADSSPISMTRLA